jgi:prepilin-type processing-associated H-X9-DG protein
MEKTAKRRLCSEEQSMKKSDCITTFVCIVFLFFILGTISQGGREQARVLACSASLKQIGAILTIYQADNDGYVPVMRNRWVIYISAETSLLSLAFRNYSPELAKLPPWLPPDNRWDSNQILEYAENWLPDFYICPFARNKSEAALWQTAGTVEVCPGVTRTNLKCTGRMDSYSTWIWPRDAGRVFTPDHCYGPDHGKYKYSNLVWHTGGKPMETGCRADQEYCQHGKFDQVHVARFSSLPRMSERTALYCAHGEIDDSDPFNQVYNYGSHKRGNKGGTNVLFGDCHVEWVQGSQIGAGN